MKYVVVYEKSTTGWAGYVPDLPGVVTTGASKDETQQLIRKAIQFHLEGLGEDNLPIPSAAPWPRSSPSRKSRFFRVE